MADTIYKGNIVMKTQWKIMVLLAMSAGFVGFAACSGGGGGSDGQGNSVQAQGGVTCYTAATTCSDGKAATAVPSSKDCPYQCGSAGVQVQTRDGGTGTGTVTN